MRRVRAAAARHSQPDLVPPYRLLVRSATDDRLSPMSWSVMPKVQFLDDSGESTAVHFERGSLPYSGEGLRESLLDVALHHGVDLQHLCGGICACITCHVIIESGDENLSPMA